MRQLKLWAALGLFMIYGLFTATNVQAMSTLIPGAHSVEVKAYDDLTTNNDEIGQAFLGAMSADSRNLRDWDENGNPSKPSWLIPQDKVPGLQITGMFDDSHFVIRIPDKWNGELVVGAAGGTGSELSADERLSDFVLTRFDANGASYAYAYTDKGTRGETIPGPDGTIHKNSKTRTAFLHPQDSIEEWNMRMKQLTIATKDLLSQLKGNHPSRTYISGTSNGGYVTRYALENSGDLYDGGLDWEGVLWNTQINNISIKVEELRNWKILQDQNASAEEKELARERYGFPPESDFLMIKQYRNGRALSPDSLRMKYDPTYIHRDWWEYGSHPEDYDNYNWQDRPQEVKQNVASISLSGKIQKPLISLAGTWDVQINPRYNAIGYDEMIKTNGKGDMHRLYMIERANHVDGIVGNPKIDKDKLLQPILPYYHQAFDLLIDWVENGNLPPDSKTIGVPTSGDKAISITTGEEIDRY
ncbi:MAG: tannase/feruloyl esterase family alpha/beta hydrolase [Veillonellales bacterium]